MCAVQCRIQLDGDQFKCYFFDISVDKKLSQMFGFTGKFIAMDGLIDGTRIFL